MDSVANIMHMLRFLGAHSYVILHTHVMLHSLELDEDTVCSRLLLSKEMRFVLYQRTAFKWEFIAVSVAYCVYRCRCTPTIVCMACPFKRANAPLFPSMALDSKNLQLRSPGVGTGADRVLEQCAGPDLSTLCRRCWHKPGRHDSAETAPEP